MKDIKVYVWAAGHGVHPLDDSNKVIIKHCEKHGEVYSIEDFEVAVNDDSLYLTDNYIKFIQQ